jgi:hypothetical protein
MVTTGVPENLLSRTIVAIKSAPVVPTPVSIIILSEDDVDI